MKGFFAAVAAFHSGYGLVELVEREVVGEDGVDVELTRKQQALHAGPGGEHAPPVDAVDVQALEDDLVHVDRHGTPVDAEDVDAPRGLRELEGEFEEFRGAAPPLDRG